MKVGGPLRGYNRAVRISAQYTLYCFCIGAALIVPVTALVAPRDFLGVVAGFIFIHFWITAAMFLTSLPANLLFVRLFRGRTWRNERWRSFMAGGLGIAITGGGMILVGISGVDRPDILRLLGEFGVVLNFVGWFILFSNLALLVAWCLPSRNR